MSVMTYVGFDGWPCSVCTFMNPNDAPLCQACGICENPNPPFIQSSFGETNFGWEIEENDRFQIAQCLNQFSQRPRRSSSKSLSNVGVPGAFGSKEDLAGFRKECWAEPKELVTWESSPKQYTFGPRIFDLMTQQCDVIILFGLRSVAVTLEETIASRFRGFVGNGGVLILDEVSFYISGRPMREFIRSCRSVDLGHDSRFEGEEESLEIWRYGTGCVIRCTKESPVLWSDVVEYALDFVVIDPVQDTCSVLSEFVESRQLVTEMLSFAFDVERLDVGRLTRTYSFCGSYCHPLSMS